MDKPLTTTYVAFPSIPLNWFQHPRLRNHALDKRCRLKTIVYLKSFKLFFTLITVGRFLLKSNE